MIHSPKSQANSRVFVTITIVVLTLLFLVSASFFVFTYYYSDRIFPNVYVNNIKIGGKTKEEAKALLSETSQTPQNLELLAQEPSSGTVKKIDLSLKEIELQYDIESTIEEAFETYRNGSFTSNIRSQFGTVLSKTVIPLVVKYNDQKLEEFLHVTADSETTTPEYPSIKVTTETLTVNPGKPGYEIEEAQLESKILDHLKNRNFEPISITYAPVNPALTDEESEAFKIKAQNILGKSITLRYEYLTYTLKDQKLLSILNPRDTLFEPKTQALIAKEIIPVFNRPSQNAVFKFVDNKVEEFKPAKDGITVNEEQLIQELKTKVDYLLTSDEKSVTIDVPVQTAAPTVTTQEVNELGINELIGRGTSVFKGSIASRVFNVGHASGKLNGVLIPPNTVFSFDDTVGDVSQLTGYKQAYIIQNGRTILGDGGGLCQVSTTLFRAALNAGLPIIERRAHAYRVGYYEQDSGPGLDATVYVPTTDFKFKNDTPNTILIQTVFDPKAMTLAFELYGTKDGRVSEITKPKVTNVIAPPEDLYIDDPTLPTGKVTQVEHKAWGATVKFDYTVTRNGEQIYQKTFTSVYQPWQAVYMRGVGPAV